MGAFMATINDIVLVYFEDSPLVFARIEDISPDVKPNWYQVRLLLLQVPVQTVTWILREAYIDGAEFSMNGKKMRLEKIVAPEATPEASPAKKQTSPKKPAAGKKEGAKVIALSDLKKKENPS